MIRHCPDSLGAIRVWTLMLLGAFGVHGSPFFWLLVCVCFSSLTSMVWRSTVRYRRYVGSGADSIGGVSCDLPELSHDATELEVESEIVR